MKDRSGLPDRVLAAIEILSLGSWVGALAGFAFVTAPLAYSLVAPISVSRFAALTIGSLAALTLWGYVFGGLALGVAVVRALDAVEPTVQSTFEPPGMPTEVPMKPVDWDIGLPLVLASP